MPRLTNLTPHAVELLVTKDAAGEPLVVCVLKAAFTWTPGTGALAPAEPSPILALDEYAGDPATSGLVRAAELTAPKPAVDVLVVGALEFGRPVTEQLVALQVGSELRKVARLHGDRFWLPGVIRSFVASDPRPITRLPLAWERSFGGGDPADPRRYEPDNPVGRGMIGRRQDPGGLPLPNLEDPLTPLDSPGQRVRPVGFGPVAPHWAPRARLAGTYDDRWRAERFPLPPLDVDPFFLNAAPDDQRLPRYVPESEVRLVGMTPEGDLRFTLPALEFPVTFATRSGIQDAEVVVDTVIIEPATSTASLIARATCAPRPSALALDEVVVGRSTRALRRALETGRECRSRAART